MKKLAKRLGAMILTGVIVSTLVVSASAVTYVAKIGSTGYKTLNAALMAVKNGQTIELQTNIYSSLEKNPNYQEDGVIYDYEGRTAKSFTIDCNGKTIFASGEASGIILAATESAGNLSVTLKDGIISASGLGACGVGVFDDNTATATNLTLTNMKITADRNYGIVCVDSNLCVKGNVSGLDNAIFAQDSKITIQAGEFQGKGRDVNKDGAIGCYHLEDNGTYRLDMSQVTMPGKPTVIRPTNWKTNLSSTISVVNYDDVKCKDHSKPAPWFYHDVYEMAQRGVISGDGNLWTFHPQNNVTREQFVQILASAAQADLSAYEGTTSFQDVKTSRWSAKAIEWAYANKIVSGTGHGKYSPSANITRQEVCVMLNKYQANIMKIAPQHKVEVGVYPDSSKIDTWAEKAVHNMLMQDIISGVKQKDGTVLLVPKGNTTRAQICTMMRAMLDLKQS